jgi:hypothetical protein
LRRAFPGTEIREQNRADTWQVKAWQALEQDCK